MGFVYILTNDAMPDCIKIGRTDDLKRRVQEMDNTSVPLPFKLHFAIDTENGELIEKNMHDAFKNFRIRDNREFFAIDPERAVSALKISGCKEITEISNEMIDKDGQIVKETTPLRRENFAFDKVGIETGTELSFTRDAAKKCKVVDNRNVEYQGVQYSLSALAQKLLNEIGYNWSRAWGPNFFEYKGKTLVQIRDEFEMGEE